MGRDRILTKNPEKHKLTQLDQQKSMEGWLAVVSVTNIVAMHRVLGIGNVSELT